VYRQYVQSGIAPGANTVTTSAIAANTIQSWQLSSSLLNPTVNSFTGDGTTTSFTLSLPPASANTVVVTVNGITQSPVTNYSTNNTSLVFTSAPANASVIRAVQQAMIGTSIVPIDGSVTTSKLGSSLTLSGNTSFSGAISGTSATLSGTLGVTGVTTLTAQPILSSLTASSAVATDASKGLVSVTNTGSGNNVLSASPTLTGTVAAASLSLSSLTSGRVTYAGASGLLSDSANLTFDGTNLILGAANPSFQGSSSTGSASLLNNSGGAFVKVYGGSHATRANYTDFINASSTSTFTSAGYLGIGQSNPAYSLDLSSTTNGIIARFKSTSNYGQVVADNTSGTGGGLFIASQNGVASSYFGVEGAVQGNTSTDTAIYNNLAGSSIKLFTNSSATAKLILDSSGNLGLGVTPSAWNSAFRALEIKNSAGFLCDGDTAFVVNNCYFNTSNAWIYKATDFATRYQQQFGTNKWFIAPSGTAGNAITFTQAMTLDAGGQLSVGTTSAFARLTTSQSPGSAGQVNGQIAMTHAGASTAYFISTIRGAATNEPEGLTFKENATERMRIDSSGNLSVNNSAGTQYVQLQPEGSIRSIHSSGGGGDSIFSAITGISNGYQISVTVGNAQTYKWHNGGTQSMTLTSSGNLLLGTTTQRNAAKFTFEYNGSTNNGLAIMETATASGTEFITFMNPAGTNIANISRVGVSDAVSYNTTASNTTGAQLNASGVRFPATQVASANVNTLDDYEEGTWSPSIGGSTTYTAQDGYYTKCGNVVTVTGRMQVNLLSGNANTYQITNLPFTSKNTSNGSKAGGGSVGYWSSTAINVISLQTYVETNTINLVFQYLASASSAALTATIFGNSTDIYFTATYLT